MNERIRLDNAFDNSVMHLLHRAAQCADEIFMRGTTGSVRPRQLAVLLAVKNNPGATQTKLVNVTGIDRSTMANIVRRLHARRLIQRRRVRNDARAYEIKLTEVGVIALREATDVSLLLDQQLLSALGEEPGDQFVRSLKTLIAECN